MAVKAIQDALTRYNIDISEIDLILAATLSPDYYFPGIGVLVQKLGSKAPAIDIRGQCSGFSWMISTANAYIRSGQFKKILIVGAEIHTKVIEFSDRGRNVSVLFGDGAGAMILGAESSDKELSVASGDRGVIDNHLGSDGSGAEYLAITRPGMSSKHKDFLTEEETKKKPFYLLWMVNMFSKMLLLECLNLLQYSWKETR